MVLYQLESLHLDDYNLTYSQNKNRGFDKFLTATPLKTQHFSFLQTFLKTNPNQYQPTIHFKTQPNKTPKLIYNQSKSPLHKVRVFPQIQTQETSSRVCVLTLNLLKLLALASSLNFLVRSCTKEQVPRKSLDLHSKP